MDAFLCLHHLRNLFFSRKRERGGGSGGVREEENNLGWEQKIFCPGLSSNLLCISLPPPGSLPPGLPAPALSLHLLLSEMTSPDSYGFRAFLPITYAQ